VITLADVVSLPPILKDAEAADIWGVSIWTLGEQARQHKAPVEPLWLGRCRRWPTVLVLRSIGIEWSPGQES
jgi:hypothetical protein